LAGAFDNANVMAHPTIIEKMAHSTWLASNTTNDRDRSQKRKIEKVSLRSEAKLRLREFNVV
jgi:hypothetical protein